MVRYSYEQKAEALKLAGEIGVYKAQEKLGISIQTIYKWRSEAKKPETQPAKETAKGYEKTVSREVDVHDLLNADDGALASLEALQNENKRLMDENNSLRIVNQRLKKALALFVEY